MADFTIIDDLPKGIVADALEIVFHHTLRDAQAALQSQLVLATSAIAAPGGRHDRYPGVEQVRAAGATVADAVAEYLVQLELASRIHENVEQIRAEATP